MTCPAAADTPGSSRLWSALISSDTPELFAALYRQAAAFIREHGYDGADGSYEGSHGISICHALSLAAQKHFSAKDISAEVLTSDTRDLTDELEKRLGGFLFVAGQRTWSTNIGALGNEVTAWEHDFVRVPGSRSSRWHTADEAILVLETAAQVCDLFKEPS